MFAEAVWIGRVTQLQSIEELDGAIGGLEGGLKGHRPIHIRTSCGGRTHGADRPVPGVIIQDRCKHGFAVEPGKAQPHYGAVSGYQRSGVPI